MSGGLGLCLHSWRKRRAAAFKRSGAETAEAAKVAVAAKVAAAAKAAAAKSTRITKATIVAKAAKEVLLLVEARLTRYAVSLVAAHETVTTDAE